MNNNSCFNFYVTRDFSLVVVVCVHYSEMKKKYETSNVIYQTHCYNSNMKVLIFFYIIFNFLWTDLMSLSIYCIMVIWCITTKQTLTSRIVDVNFWHLINLIHHIPSFLSFPKKIEKGKWKYKEKILFLTGMQNIF